MKKLLLFSTFLIFACSSDSEGNPWEFFSPEEKKQF